VECKTKEIPVIIIATGTISKSFRILSEQHKGTARNQGTTENSLIGHCTRIWECANVSVQKRSVWEILHVIRLLK